MRHAFLTTLAIAAVAVQAAAQLPQSTVAAKPLTYAQAYAEAVRTGKPLIVYVGDAPSYAVDGAVPCRVWRLTGYPAECAVVMQPNGADTIAWEKVIDKPTPDSLRKAVQPAALPKARRNSADGDLKLPVGSIEALELVNARRAKHGLRPFIYDAGLTLAAARAATYRAERLLFGHCPSDFVHLPEGCHADAAGCAAYDAETTRLFDGWLSCCSDDNYTYAGAAYVVGTDGKWYMHLFVSNQPPVRGERPALPQSTLPVRGVGVKCELCPNGQCPPGNCPNCPDCLPLKKALPQSTIQPARRPVAAVPIADDCPAGT